MIKHISLVHRRPELTHADFIDYWKNRHAKLVRTKLPKLRRYVANFPAEWSGPEPQPGSGAQLSCDAVVELHFDDLADLRAAMSSAGWLDEERKASSDYLIDYARHQFIVADEYVVDLQSVDE